MITFISSILAFAAGFLFCLVCLVKGSDEKWEKFKNAVEKARETAHDKD